MGSVPGEPGENPGSLASQRSLTCHRECYFTLASLLLDARAGPPPARTSDQIAVNKASGSSRLTCAHANSKIPGNWSGAYQTGNAVKALPDVDLAATTPAWRRYNPCRCCRPVLCIASSNTVDRTDFRGLCYELPHRLVIRRFHPASESGVACW